MIIEGMQKLTLLDYPGHIAATLFTHGCNLRCPFCHNSGLVTREPENSVSMEELGKFLEKRVGMLDGICVTGGEPLLNPEISDLLAFIKSYGYKIKLDTNGFFPENLKNVVSEDLVDYIAMDIKSSKENYAAVCGRDKIDIAKPEESVDFIMNCGVDYEFRTTCVGGLHTEDDFEGIGQWIQGCKRYFLQQYVDSGDVINPIFKSPSDIEMKAFLQRVKPYVENAQIRGI